MKQTCQHKYKLPEASKKECPFPAIFQKYKSYFNFELDLDDKDICLFHSLNLEWKKNKFWTHFIQLIKSINTINEEFDHCLNYHFIEFQIVSFGNTLEITKDLKLSAMLDFRNAVFHNAITYTGVTFEYANFTGSKMKMFTKFQSCNFKQLQFEDVQLNGLSFSNNTIENFSRFNGTTFNLISDFYKSVFKGSVNFTDCKFLAANDDYRVRFEDCYFEGEIDFNYARFESDLHIKNSFFYKPSEFIDTFFDIKSDVGFYNIKVLESLSFKSTKENKKLFNSTVAFLIKDEDIRGRLIFENVNFLNIFKEHKDHLLALQAQDKVEIGKGCIKYRLRTPNKKLQIDDLNQNLVTELTGTFIQFFKVSNGLNLGVEIVDRTEGFIEIFYFSDEDMTYPKFEKMLVNSEEKMWRLVKINNQSIVTKKENKLHSKRDKYIMTTDVIIDLVSLALKISTRFSVGRINKEEINSLTSTISNKNSLVGKQIQTLNVYQNIILGIGNSQNLSL